MVTDYTSGWTIVDAALELERMIERTGELLRMEDPGAPRAGRVWSRQQELGHLCDSALNNIQRFVRLQIPAHLDGGEWRAQGYEQDDWVRVMDYAAMPWSELVELWAALNRRVVHLMRGVRAECLENRWVVGEKRYTLEWLMVDYTGHHQHHLQSIFGGSLER